MGWRFCRREWYVILEIVVSSYTGGRILHVQFPHYCIILKEQIDVFIL